MLTEILDSLFRCFTLETIRNPNWSRQLGDKLIRINDKYKC